MVEIQLIRKFYINFKERLSEISCKMNKFKYILENIFYCFYKANLTNKSPIEWII